MIESNMSFQITNSNSLLELEVITLIFHWHEAGIQINSQNEVGLYMQMMANRTECLEESMYFRLVIIYTLSEIKKYVDTSNVFTITYTYFTAYT